MPVLAARTRDLESRAELEARRAFLTLFGRQCADGRAACDGGDDGVGVASAAPQWFGMAADSDAGDVADSAAHDDGWFGSGLVSDSAMSENLPTHALSITDVPVAGVCEADARQDDGGAAEEVGMDISPAPLPEAGAAAAAAPVQAAAARAASPRLAACDGGTAATQTCGEAVGATLATVPNLLAQDVKDAEHMANRKVKKARGCEVRFESSPCYIRDGVELIDCRRGAASTSLANAAPVPAVCGTRVDDGENTILLAVHLCSDLGRWAAAEVQALEDAPLEVIPSPCWSWLTMGRRDAVTLPLTAPFAGL